MRMLRFPVVAELRNRSILALGNEDGVEAEALVTRRFGGDVSCERARAAELLAVRAERDELAHVAGPSLVSLDTLQLAEHPAHLVPGGAARRVHAWPAAEAGDLDAGVLSQHPDLRRGHTAPELRLCQRVVVVGLARLGRIAVGIEHADLPTRQQPLQLARLVGVARGELGVQ